MSLIAPIVLASKEVSTLPKWIQVFERIVLPNWETALGLIMAFIVATTMLKQKRKQSNIIAWTLFILISPVLGSLFFMLIGGRKHNRTLRTKRTINTLAGVLTHEDDPLGPPKPELGNSFELLDDPDGTAMWHAMCREIDTAKKSIHITTYILGADDVGREIIKRLAQRAKDGVEVRLLIDAVGSWGAKYKICNPLIEAGGKVQRFMPVIPFQGRGSANFRNHRKMAVFDGQRAIIGGQNLADDYIGPEPSSKRYRDFSALISGPSVAELTRIFLSDWCFASGETPDAYTEQLKFNPEPTGAVKMEIVSGGPDEPNDPIWEHFLLLFQECRKGMTLVTPYLVPDEVLFRILLSKLRMGHKIRFIVPRKSDHPFLDLARRPYLRALHKAGAQILLYEKGILHGKLFISDNTVGVVGSANLDMRSLFVNFEVATFVHSQNTVRRLRLLADSLATDSTPYEGSKLHKFNWRNRSLEALAHMVGPLL
ncbi:MAG: phospholipase D-like domain-containing protein [Puniceicoccales bacterium]|jgi:cardiolipin synthase|nr:phospholipase D-like domain-containing protein [Puniceicoccales bacterium]